MQTNKLSDNILQLTKACFYRAKKISIKLSTRHFILDYIYKYLIKNNIKSCFPQFAKSNSTLYIRCADKQSSNYQNR